MMKLLIVLLLCLLSAGSLHAHGLGFMKNPTEAAAYALVNDCPLLVFFTGSDWSPLSHELDLKVWEDIAFATHLNQHYPMLNADYPQRVQLQPKHKEGLRKFAERYHIRHFPTILALTHEMREIGRLEYRGETAAEVAAVLDNWEVKYVQLQSAANVSSSTPPSYPEPSAHPVAAPAPAAATSELKVGDLLPDLTFTSSEEKPVKLSDFKGKTLLFTFVFTRCPLPDYCPLQSWKFGQVQKILSEDAAVPKDWHLLSISIDPKHDTTETLAKYAAMHGAQAAHWTLVTGELCTISSLALRLGADFWADKDGLITHHMRTVLVGEDGRIRSITTDSKWSPEKMAKDIKDLVTLDAGKRAEQ
jgi:cytochrome oxidase Cu insertion factor (SCO1/SenC/PrrC family)